MVDIRSESRPRSRGFLAIMTLIGLIVGIAAGWATGSLMKGAGLQHLPWSDVAALAIALFFLGLGLTMGVFSIDQKGLALLDNPGAPEFSRPVGAAQKAYLRLQAAVMTLAGVLLAAPVVYSFSAGRLSMVGGPIWMFVIASLFAVQSLLNLSIWRRSDEVFRQTIAETGALCFWLLQGVLFLWAAGEKLRVLPSISTWDAMTVMMGVYLVASTIAAYRRGLG